MRIIASAAGLLRDRRLHQFLWFCLPAVAVGLALRVALMAEAPRALLQPDSPDLLATAREMVDDGRFLVKGKRTFLVPALYTAACFVPGMSGLTAVAAGQHALGMGSVLLAGLLCRLWLRGWRWAIVPVTLAVAANPALLWYEHVLMAESVYLFTTLLLAAAGSWFALRPGKGSFAALAVGLFLQAGARPEGKLFFAFGFLLCLLVFARSPKRLALAAAGLLAVAIPAHLATRTSQSGLLLLVSLAHLAPDEFASSPGLGAELRPIRDALRAEWADGPAFPGSKMRKEVSRAVERWLAATGGGDARGTPDKAAVNRACKEAAMEIARVRWAELPALAYLRFRHVAPKTTGERFEAGRFQEEQAEVLAEDFGDLQPIARHLFGREIGAEPEVVRFLREGSPDREIGWVRHLDEIYVRANEAWCFPGAYYDDKERPGIPVFYAVAGCGLLLAMGVRGGLGRFHLAWGPMLLGLLVVIVLTGSPKPRFQFVFTPFLPLYMALCFDRIWALCGVGRGAAARGGGR